MNRNIRTDLAIELHETIERDQEQNGIAIKKKLNKTGDIATTIIDVINENGVRNIGKPIGRYITIESSSLEEADESIHQELSEELSHNIKQMLGGATKIMVAGLGNRMVTPDALGPLVIDNLYITRHMKHEKTLSHILTEDCIEISGISPGVMAQTGIETMDILKSVSERVNPEVMIVIDALAARSGKRLSRTIQLTDTGISPGSGVGNNRMAINEETMGMRVIAIGVPMVISVPSIVSDSMDRILSFFPKEILPDNMDLEDENKRYNLACGMVEPETVDMFVTPKNIDELIKRISFTISEAINNLLVENTVNHHS